MKTIFNLPPLLPRKLTAALVLGLGLLPVAIPAAETVPGAGKVPVILDTDIGDDIDDTWALGFLLKSPELDVKLVVGDYGRPQYRARLLAKFLNRVGRSDIPVGLGIEAPPKGDGRQIEWVKDYDLASYPGKVHRDGVQAMIGVIMQSPEPVTLICTGPLPNIAEALKREPRIAERARFVGMDGSLRIGYGGSHTPAAEWNVRADAKACQKVFAAGWGITITPLDTCGLVHLTGDKYRQVRESKDPIALAIIENYRLWLARSGQKADLKRAESQSSTLFDTVAVYLAFSQQLCKMETLGVRVTDDGFTRINPQAKMVHAATAWKDLGAYENLMVARLTGQR